MISIASVALMLFLRAFLFAMVDHIPNLSFGFDSDGEIDLSSQELAGCESPLSEEMMRMLWITGTNALFRFLIFLSIAMFPAVCHSGCYYRATFSGGSSSELVLPRVPTQTYQGQEF